MMATLTGLGLIAGGLLGARYKITALILALPFAFAFPCLLAGLGHAGWLSALAWAFLLIVGVQFGFVAGGLVSAAAGRRPYDAVAPRMRR